MSFLTETRPVYYQGQISSTSNYATLLTPPPSSQFTVSSSFESPHLPSPNSLGNASIISQFQLKYCISAPYGRGSYLSGLFCLIFLLKLKQMFIKLSRCHRLISLSDNSSPSNLKCFICHIFTKLVLRRIMSFILTGVFLVYCSHIRNNYPRQD